MNKSVGLIAAVALGAMVLVGCGKAKLDASSDEAFTNSVKTMENGMDDARKAKFEQSLALVLASNVSLGGDPKAAQQQIKKKLNGKTADDIIAEAEKLEKGLRSELLK